MLLTKISSVENIKLATIIGAEIDKNVRLKRATIIGAEIDKNVRSKRATIIGAKKDKNVRSKRAQRFIRISAFSWIV